MLRNMKILIVDVNFDYKNPMYRQFYQNLSYCLDVDYFGPGYTKREILEKGIEEYINAHGKYDAIIVGIYFVYSAQEKMRYDAYMVHRHVIPYYTVNDAYQCCNVILDELNSITNIVKILFYYEDFCSMTLGDYRETLVLLEKGYYVMSWPYEYMTEVSCRTRRKYSFLTNYAMDIAKRKERYIPITMHAIAEHEIFVQNISMRKWGWCVPGNRKSVYYPDREKAATEIKTTVREEKVWDFDPFQKLSVNTIEKQHLEWYQFRNNFEKVATIFLGKNKYISTFPKTTYIAACRENYMDSMRKSKKVYVDGGAANCFVRKYFESCACGALTIVKRIPGLQEMGFIDGQNCIVIENYQELQRQVDRFKDDERNEQIAKEGQQLILDKHMYYHRAIALRKTIDDIKAGIYKGAIWRDGNYITLE